MFKDGSFIIEICNSVPAIRVILWGHDVMGIAESNGMRFDLMRHIHRLMWEQVPVCEWMTGIF